MVAGTLRVLVVAALVLHALPALAAPIVSIQPAASTVSNGNTTLVDVAIADATDLLAFQLSVRFDPLLLAVVSATEGSFLDPAGTGNFFEGFVDPLVDPGVLSFVANALNGLGPGVSGNGVLFSIRFRGIGVGTSALTPFFDPNNGDALLNSALNETPAEPVEGSLTVRPRTGVPEPVTLFLLAPAVFAASRRVRRNRWG